jgi:small subunit ribosomal protein S1
VSINLGLQGQDWARAQQLLESGEVVEGEITGYNKGGLLVRFGRLEGFLPISHALDIPQGLSGPQRSETMAGLVGTQLGLKVIEVNQRRRRLILSQREAQREWRMTQKERLLDSLKIGDIVPGRVTGIRDFGVFVDIGGADGLIHVSELAWHRIPHPSDILSIGDQINVYVLELDREQQRIALSLARTVPDPWRSVEDTYEIGQIVEGTVNNVVDFGAFVVLDDGIEGLLHVTEMGDGTLTEPHSFIQRGDHITLQIVRIEAAEKRIGFTQKGLNLAGPADTSGQAEPDTGETPGK